MRNRITFALNSGDHLIHYACMRKSNSLSEINKLGANLPLAYIAFCIYVYRIYPTNDVKHTHSQCYCCRLLFLSFAASKSVIAIANHKNIKWKINIKLFRIAKYTHTHTHTKHFRIGEILLEIEKLEKEKHFENLNGGIFEFIKLFYSSLTAIAF